MASIVLSATLIAAWCTGYFDGYERSGGFYLGCFTSGLYFVCFCLLAVNYGGYLLGEYDATFNLDQSQRGLMIHTVMLGAWLCIGPGMFMHLVSSGPWDSYATSLYYTIILVTTIGLGDVLPKIMQEELYHWPMPFRRPRAWSYHFVAASVCAFQHWANLILAPPRTIPSKG